MKHLIIILLTLLLVSCNDMYDVPREPIWNDSTETTQLLVLSEGLFNMNNSTLALVDLQTGNIDYDHFRSTNGRGLGDTGNDMQLYGSKIYITVNISSQLEVIDAHTHQSIKRIALFNDDNVARQPRYVTFHHNKAYVSCFDGWVARIDTTTLEIDGWAQCGNNPDHLAVCNNKLYVSNSGGLDNPFYDNSVSVIDLESFNELRRIQVGVNPGPIATDSEGDVYVITRGDYDDEDYTLHKIDSEIDTVVETFTQLHPLKMIVHNDLAYMYSYNYKSGEQWIKVFDCLTDKVINENFITDGTTIQTPFSLTINPANGDLYITEAYNYVLWGDVLCFNRNGQLRFRLNEIGLNPNAVIIF